MGKKEKSSSCFGLFVKSWLLSFLALGSMTAGLVALGIRYVGWNAQHWQDFSAWNSYPVLALLGIGLASTGLAFAVAGFIGVASAFLGGGKSKAASSSGTRSKPRPQSNRKTTI